MVYVNRWDALTFEECDQLGVSYDTIYNDLTESELDYIRVIIHKSSQQH